MWQICPSGQVIAAPVLSVAETDRGAFKALDCAVVIWVSPDL